MPFHCDGLWLAVSTIPPAAFNSVTMTAVLGVVAIPRSMTSLPPASNPLVTALRTMSPLGRESRPSTIGFPPTNFAIAHPAEAANCGVKVCPTIPRIPDTPIIKAMDETFQLSHPFNSWAHLDAMRWRL